MPETVTTHRTRHVSSPEVYAHEHQPTDSDAATIASWYQSPRDQGQVFLALAQGQHVQPGYLAAAIATERALPGTYGKDMDILERWLERATRHPSEQELAAALTPSPRQARAAARIEKARRS